MPETLILQLNYPELLCATSNRNSPRSGRLEVAQHLSAGNQSRQETQPVKRAAEYF